MAVSIFSTLPQDLLAHIGEYWDDKKECVYRRTMNLLALAQSNKCQFSSPLVYVSKIIKMKFPDLLVPVRHRSYSTNPTKVKLSETSCIVIFPSGRRRQFQFNGIVDLFEFDEWIIKYVKPCWDNVIDHWSLLLKQQYPTVFSLAESDNRRKTIKTLVDRQMEIFELRNIRS